MKYLIVFIHLFFALVVLGQKPIISIEVSDTEPSIGQNITISITTSLNGNVEFEFPSSFKKGYAQMEGMSQEYKNGVSKTIYYKTQNGFFTEGGVYMIGPAIVKSKNKVYKSNRVTISVEKSKKTTPKKNNFNRNLKTIKTLYSETNVSKSQIYEGESVYLKAKVFSKYRFSKYGYTPYGISGTCDNFEIKNKNPLALVEEQIDGELFYTLELDERIIFPLKSGKYIVEPFEFNIIENSVYRMNADRKSIIVRKLPVKNRPQSFIGLVGDFVFNVELSKLEAQLNEVITLQISIKGTGNFQHAIAPSLILPDEVELYADPVRTKKYGVSKNGFEGELNYSYPLKVLKNTRTSLPEIVLSYFDPDKKEYVTYRSASFQINQASENNEVMLTESSLQQKPNTDQGSGSEKSIKGVKKEIKNENSRAWILLIWIVLITVGVLLFIWIFLKRRSNQNKDTMIHYPTAKEIKILLNEIEHLPDTCDAGIVLSKMEECLARACSFLIGVERLKVSRNELYVLLLDKLSPDVLLKLKQVFSRLDSVRFSNESSDFAMNNLKSDFKGLVNEILVK